MRRFIFVSLGRTFLLRYEHEVWLFSILPLGIVFDIICGRLNQPQGEKMVMQINFQNRRPIGRPATHGRYSHAYAQFREAYRRVYGQNRPGRPRVIQEPGWSVNLGPTGDIPPWSPPPLSPTTLPGSPRRPESPLKPEDGNRHIPTRFPSPLTHQTFPASPKGPKSPLKPGDGSRPIPTWFPPPLTHEAFPAGPSGSYTPPSLQSVVFGDRRISPQSRPAQGSPGQPKYPAKPKDALMSYFVVGLG
ncbi:uncharacterized protein LOC142765405 isoform X3 [Rhipicephalus microplus]|uniref:uncharacterized protein LOC142765405 isoform X3 n=1 Tax=Rhipicephalus microplus TaxID=6941 RepID=UPI003F6A84B2